MEPLNISSAQELKDLIERRSLSHIKVGVFDIDGIMRGKYMSREKFLSALDKGFGFCDVILGWDSNDQLYDNVSFTGWHTGYGDAPVRLLPETCRELPMEQDSILVMGEFDQAAAQVCPRATLGRVLARAEKMGFSLRCGFEFEFFVFDESPESVREKNYKNLQAMAPGHFGYSMLRTSVHADFYRGLLQLCEEMDMPIEGLHEETGPGVMEAALCANTAMQAADQASLFKTFTKIYAQKHGRMATFMARWSPDWPGQSGHIHISITDKKGNSIFHDPDKPGNMSDAMNAFVAGQQQLMPQMLAMVAPTVNSYSRLVPGFWAPTDASWGIENRTCALRVIPGGANSQRVEYRIAAADANPYLALAAAIASGLSGIEQQLSPSKPVRGNAYEEKFPKSLALPTTLWDAAQLFKKSTVASDWLGEAFVAHFAATREWEEREFRRHITDWELQRYFEII
ncbi:MAG: glutamine synthetase [Proteobacteria bacterium]|nr:glutamine synthetase [Pseudomonadota bacterium]